MTVLYNYSYYGLPAPRRGQVYVRYQQYDVFLIASADRTILDAFTLQSSVTR